TFNFIASHTYAATGSFTITVNIAVPNSHNPNANTVITTANITVPAPTLQSIIVSPTNPSITKGLTQQFTAIGTFSDNSMQNITSQVTWSSATPTVATIDATGKATGVGVGTSVITASLNGITSPGDPLTVTAAAVTVIPVADFDGDRKSEFGVFR